MSNNLLVLPKCVLFCIMVEEVNNLIVCKEFFFLIIIQFAKESDSAFVLLKFIIQVIQAFDYLCSKPLSIFLGVHKEGAPNKVLRPSKNQLGLGSVLVWLPIICVGLVVFLPIACAE